MTENAQRLLRALVSMTQQYLRTDDGHLDHLCMGAGERAIELLAEYGFVIDEGRYSRWTDAGWKFYMETD